MDFVVHEDSVRFAECRFGVHGSVECVGVSGMTM